MIPLLSTFGVLYLLSSVVVVVVGFNKHAV